MHKFKSNKVIDLKRAMDEQAGDADEALEGNGSDAPNAESAGAELRDADFSLLNDDSDPGSGGSDGTDAARLKQLESELASEREKHLRALADLENYKRSAIKERSQLVKYQGQQVFQDLLEVVDDMERALQFAEPVSEEAGLSEESQLRE